MKRIPILLAAAVLLGACSPKNFVDGQTGLKAEICRYRGDRKAAVSLTFDDGVSDHYTMVAPHLDSLGLKGTFWICPERLYDSRNVEKHHLTWDQARKMAASGHEISNHGWSHRNLKNISFEEAKEEVTKCDEAIRKEIGKAPVTMCFPYNAYNDAVLEFCSAGRVGCRLYQEAQGQKNHHSTPESLSSWLEKTIRDGSWGVTMTHGIHHGYDQWDDENVLWNFYRQLASRQDEVWVGTFAQVASYIKERDNCTLKVKKSGRSVIITPECSLDPELYRENLTVRVTLDGEVRLFEVNPFGGSQKFEIRNEKNK